MTPDERQRCKEALQSGEDAEGDKGDGDEDAAGDLPGEVGLRRGGPVHRLLDDAQLHEQGIQGAVVGVSSPSPLSPSASSPDCRALTPATTRPPPWTGPTTGRSSSRSGEDNNGPGDLPAAELVVEDQGQHKAQHRGQHHHGDGPHQGAGWTSWAPASSTPPPRRSGLT